MILKEKHQKQNQESRPFMSNKGEKMSDEVKLGIYEHFKGKRYEVVGTAHHSETLEEMVVYRALYESKEFGKNALWVRPLTMFCETVTREGKEFPRFRYIGPA